MSLVDLHVHTHFSDGYDSPSDVVAEAAENGVAAMAVTDHDNLGGLAEAMAAGKRLGVKVVAGVEVSSSFRGGTIHILGLGVSPADPAFVGFLDGIYSRRRDLVIAKMGAISAAFASAGRPAVDMEDFIGSQGRYFNREKAGRYLVANGFVAGSAEAFRLVNEADPGLGSGFRASAAQVIAAIRAAGGLAILAHPFARSTSLRKLDPDPAAQEAMLKELLAAGLDGFECYQSEYGPEERAFALGLAAKYGALASAGSDWHGAVCDLGWDIKSAKVSYPEHIGGLGVTAGQIAPLLERLGIAVDKA